MGKDNVTTTAAIALYIVMVTLEHRPHLRRRHYYELNTAPTHETNTKSKLWGGHKVSPPQLLIALFTAGLSRGS